MSRQLLRALKPRLKLLWCCIGDFNGILSHNENKDGPKLPESLINDFRGVVECRLSEVRMLGHPFTRENSRGQSSCIEEKLDTALAQEDWFNVFPDAHVINGDSTGIRPYYV